MIFLANLCLMGISAQPGIAEPPEDTINQYYREKLQEGWCDFSSTCQIGQYSVIIHGIYGGFHLGILSLHCGEEVVILPEHVSAVWTSEQVKWLEENALVLVCQSGGTGIHEEYGRVVRILNGKFLVEQRVFPLSYRNSLFGENNEKVYLWKEQPEWLDRPCIPLKV